MGHIHNIRENQNHRIADVTPGALRSSTTPAPPVCTAAATAGADTQIEARGQSMIKASRSIRGDGVAWRS